MEARGCQRAGDDHRRRAGRHVCRPSSRPVISGGSSVSSRRHSCAVSAAATSTAELRELNRRARAFTLEYLTDAAAVEWLARMAHLVDVAIVRRILELACPDDAPGCWCFSGAAGRAESMPGVAPHLVVIAERRGRARGGEGRLRTRARMVSSNANTFPRRISHSTRHSMWPRWRNGRSRYRGWIQDPVRQQMYLARTLFDLRAVHGDRSLWTSLEATVTAAVDRDFVHVLANDCLASLPPLTFYQDAVIDSVGERHATFQLAHSALKPLVDVGRVFGMAAGQVLGRSTLERFGVARTLLPENEAIFREASDALRVVLWQQGRVGISSGHVGLGAAACLAQPPRPPPAQGRIPRHPPVDRVHRRSRVDRSPVSHPPFIERYLAHFDATWADDTPNDRVRFVVLDSETTGLNPRTDRIITIGAVAVRDVGDPARGCVRRADQGRTQHRGRDRARGDAETRASKAWTRPWRSSGSWTI